MTPRDDALVPRPGAGDGRVPNGTAGAFEPAAGCVQPRDAEANTWHGRSDLTPCDLQLTDARRVELREGDPGDLAGALGRLEDAVDALSAGTGDRELGALLGLVRWRLGVLALGGAS